VTPQRKPEITHSDSNLLNYKDSGMNLSKKQHGHPWLRNSMYRSTSDKATQYIVVLCPALHPLHRKQEPVQLIIIMIIIIKFISWVSEYRLLDVPGSIKFLPVHIHYIANDYSLSILYIISWKVLVLSTLIIVFQSSHNLILPSAVNLSCASFASFSHLHLISYTRLPNFLYSGDRASRYHSYK
jgi:hypothetical protein